MKKLIVLFLIVVLVVIYPMLYINSADTTTFTVKRTERVTVGSGNSVRGKYLVFTENEVFENTDSYLFLKFNSSDLENKLTPGKEYRAKVAGWRIPFLSMYRNIIKVYN